MYMYNIMFLSHTYIHILYFSQYIHISPILFSPLYISHLLPIFDINAKGVCYMVMPKCNKKSECTFKINVIVLSQFSYNTLLAWNAIYTSTNNSIMWSAMEKLLSWMSVLACAMCFYNASMLWRIMPWMSCP